MAIPKKLLTQLDTAKARYEIVKHRKVFTAYDLAQTTKSKLTQVAKTLLVKADKDFVVVTIPAHLRLDLKKLKALLKVKSVTIVTERSMLKQLKAKPGALIPFGSHYKIASVVDRALWKTEKILIGAGSFTESLRLRVKDWSKIDEPKVGPVGQKGKKG
jgi:Ala-tRNA(Pro) deacylase